MSYLFLFFVGLALIVWSCTEMVTRWELAFLAGAGIVLASMVLEVLVVVERAGGLP